jgi:putative metal-binding protein
MMVRMVVGLSLVLGSAGTSAAKTKPVLCPAGRFLVDSAVGALLPGVGAGLEGVGFDAQGHVTLDGCGPATHSRAKATKRLTLLTAKWNTCATFKKIVLTAKIPTVDCAVLSGKVKAKKQKAKTFSAPRSACGDAHVDAVGGEECDTGTPCPDAVACSDACTCPLPTTTTTLGCVDADGDGWTTCDGDCCDSPQDCPNPAQVNPGAFEVPANQVDDDCDGTVDNIAGSCDGGLASDTSTVLDYAKALDLCQTTTESPPTLADKTWGVISAELLLASGTGTPAPASSAIRPSFGSSAVPQAGSSMVVLSTGNAAAPADANPPYVSFQPGQNAATSSAAPADWLALNGGAFPNAPGCPVASSTTANDPVMLKVRVRVPTNARSFSVSSFFYSAEYPEWVCSAFNDVFVTLLDSTFVPGNGETGNPIDKNIAFYSAPGGFVYPVGVNLAYGNTGLFAQCVNGSTGCASGSNPAGTVTTCVGTNLLAGTGFDLADAGNCDAQSLLGGGTGWLTMSGNVAPGETIDVRFAIWDTGDHGYDSLVLLDHWVWSTTPIQPGTHG